MSPEIIGYVSSLMMIATIGTQISKQWRSGSSKGVSIWLFIGQLCTSAGFTLYSILVKSTVFTLTNVIMVVASAVGLGIVLYHRRKNRAAPVALVGPDPPRKYAIPNS